MTKMLDNYQIVNNNDNNDNSNNPKETLSQEQKVNLENLKRIMNNEKTTIP